MVSEDKMESGPYLDKRAIKRREFKDDLTKIINRHSMENEWDMPDFIMAELITDFIYSSSKTMKQNLDWHGVDSVCHPREKKPLNVT